MSNVKKKIVNAPPAAIGMFIMVWAAAICSVMCREVLTRTLPAIVEAFNMDSATAGYLSTAGNLSGAICVLFIGAAADRFGIGFNRKKPQAVCAAILLGGTFFMGLPIVATIPMLFVFNIIRFAPNLGVEIIEASASAEWMPKEDRGFALIAEHTEYPWGAVITGLLVSGLLSVSGNNWRVPFMVLPLIGLAVWLVYWNLAKEKRYAANNEKMIARGLTPSFTMEEIEAHKNTPVKERQGIVDLFRLFKNTNVLFGWTMYSLLMFMYYGFAFWIPNYLAFQCGFDSSAAAAASIVYSITAGFGQLLVGLIVDKVGSKPIIIIACLWLGAGLALMPMMSRGVVWVIVLQLVMGFAMNVTFPTIYTIAGESVQPNQLASALSICGSGCLIGSTAPAVFGAIISACGGFEVRTGFVVSIVVLVVIMVVTALVCGLLVHEVHGSKRGRDFALTKFESCGIERRDK